MAEGLFDEHLKRSLPRFPAHITLVTSPQGAAVHDFIRIATRRFPMIQIAIYPVTVQGDQAAADMVQALAEINARLATEVIVLCRGGGSIEDLWAFNDEALARAIRNLPCRWSVLSVMKSILPLPILPPTSPRAHPQWCGRTADPRRRGPKTGN